VPDEHAEHPVVASLVVQVPAGGEVEVEIRLPVGFDPSATP
jgi:Ni,Fe-hydrogenase III component G